MVTFLGYAFLFFLLQPYISLAYAANNSTITKIKMNTKIESCRSDQDLYINMVL